MQIHTRGFFPVRFRGIIRHEITCQVISFKITILTYYPDYTWMRRKASLAVKCESLECMWSTLNQSSFAHFYLFKLKLYSLLLIIFTLISTSYHGLCSWVSLSRETFASWFSFAILNWPIWPVRFQALMIMGRIKQKKKKKWTVKNRSHLSILLWTQLQWLQLVWEQWFI